ncbi:MAG: hypothetical protein COA78_38465 [Blastopirellula sp.]|nr:MAG: hypothetical protein COA78_38465 [Blastopirellula sp.]
MGNEIVNTGLAIVLKKKMNYSTNPAPRCEKCKHSEELENPHVDRMWDMFCKLTPIETLKVSGSGRCDHFEEKL